MATYLICIIYIYIIYYLSENLLNIINFYLSYFLIKIRKENLIFKYKFI